MPLEPEQLLQRATESGTLDPQKGQAALAVYERVREMGAEFSFGEFLVDRGLLTQMAVDALEGDSDETFSAIDTLGDFELVELLGEGENGAVFRAFQKSLERDVAVKVLNTEIAQDEAAVERFLREARAVAKLNHPNVVHGYSVGTEQGLHYFAMELLEGGSARSLMEAQGGRLSERRALEIVMQAAEGLKAAHERGILHRDVKPDNILLTQAGVAKLTDLGIASVVHATAEGGTFWGSPPYVAPEIITGAASDDLRSDIYSLGATLFELLIGAPPFLDSEDDPSEILRLHLSEEPHDVKHLRPELHPKTSVLVKLMLAKEPNERARDAEVVARAIEKILQELKQPVTARGVAPVTAPVKPRPAQPVRGTVARPGVARPGVVKRPLGKPLPGKALPRKAIAPARPAAPSAPNASGAPRVQRPVPGRPAIPARPASAPRAPLPRGKRPSK